MLSLPEYGLAEFSIGDVKYSLGYLSHGSTDWLESAIYGLKKFQPFIFYSWCEPEYFYCTVMENFCYIICADDEKILATHEIKMTMLDFCKELHADISKDVSAWTYFEYYGDEFEGDEYKELHLLTEKSIQSLPSMRRESLLL